jgi:hypothetical protein
MTKDSEFAERRISNLPNGAVDQDWVVARVCSEYIQYCERGLATGSISKGHRIAAVAWLGASAPELTAEGTNPGKDRTTSPTAAWVRLVLEANRQLVLHAAGQEEACTVVR